MAGKYANGIRSIYIPEQFATDTKREFNPETEVHHFGFQVKIIEPGCSFEVQIEEFSGRVTRITTTDDIVKDHIVIRNAITEAVNRLFKEFHI
jgi:hypothetical protein